MMFEKYLPLRGERMYR